MKGKRIVIGVSGGIAAYKAAELVRLLVREEALVQVAMTANAARFVSPLTFGALSGNRVVSHMFDEAAGAMDHISWGQDSDLIIIAPATANVIAKIAHGIADDFLTTMTLAATARILVCPAMNTRMYENQATQENLAVLQRRGIFVMEPGAGQLACREEGPGRLPEPAEIVDEARWIVSKQDLAGLQVLVTAGATHEPMDPVRYISNRSTGKMGYAVATMARTRGASVKLVTGPTSLPVPRGVEAERVTTAVEMREAVVKHFAASDIVVMAAAVSDYRPHATKDQKIKKGPEIQTLELVKNPDILAELGTLKGKRNCVLVGFAAETEDLLANAEKKLRDKNLDMIVANDVSREDAGFAVDTNEVKILFRDGKVESPPLMKKEEVADLVLDQAKTLREGRSGHGK
ncbi:MAG: bifunctional phosphopantothenoylcysteine decarboxylase/phosphopantothenate--cysteine ligase CoaBC [Deltaproteobacteria bacterium]|nr:MAG: bifunctional phosphopantothenoylcysteine decarboxylase/phosphopantothenate--cysteine ligase CoaBC [Deltaproteobacteria bacterium]